VVVVVVVCKPILVFSFDFGQAEQLQVPEIAAFSHLLEQYIAKIVGRSYVALWQIVFRQLFELQPRPSWTT
jgi:hypothetical protein